MKRTARTLDLPRSHDALAPFMGAGVGGRRPDARRDGEVTLYGVTVTERPATR